jgi:prepilin-type N-terminal cleavage/methylation domain-containing protein
MRLIVHSRAGFTLIEVLVGLTVSALALAAGFGALAFVHDRGIEAETSARVAVAGATQRALLMDWLMSARYRAPAGEQFNGEDLDESGVSRDRIFFPTTAPTPLEGGFTVVGLYIDTDEETPERGLVAEMTGVVLGAEERRMELVPQADAMEIRYLPNIAGEIEWGDGWTGRNELPRGIEIILSAAAGDTLPSLLRLPIRVALGARF